MKDIVIYNHGGSENHGCEALARTVVKLTDFTDRKVLLSEAPQQDIHYNVNDIVSVDTAVQHCGKLSLSFVKAYMDLKFKHDYFSMDVLPFKKKLSEFNDKVAISIGGDIYCYEDYPKFIKYHQLVKNKASKTVLLGCSLSPSLFEDPTFVEDMKSYTLVSARESLTYDLLKKAGLTNIALYPDTAFTLPKECLELPKGFIEGNTIGINLSPLVSRKEVKEGIVLENYTNLIQSILTNTDCAVALIPHVVWESNDDREVLSKLYEQFKDNERVVLIEDCNCMQLKGYISRCRFFIGARTHATIAAYSTCVPTLVLGYSIKSRGIAKDLFGSYENYVIGVDQLTDADKLTNAFAWIYKNEKNIKEKLVSFIPSYIKRCGGLKNQVQNLMEA